MIGDYFLPHRDGSYMRPDGTQISYLTIQLYLNSNPDNGGETRFLNYVSQL